MTHVPAIHDRIGRDAGAPGGGRGARGRSLALVGGCEAPAAASAVVAIVGAGPGDPNLLTLRAVQLLQAADVVVYDRLVGPGILAYAGPAAERIYVGKARGDDPRLQDGINELLVRLARQGKRVVRLKGGDPLVFGRGGEERAHLERAGVTVEVVPGITAATGCGASAGIPLTLRGVAQAVTLVTGHGEDGEPDLDWAALARLGHTLVVYMGLAKAEVIAGKLIGHGLHPGTPSAIVENGTLPSERVLTGRLDELGRMVRAHRVTGPALIVIGEVVRQAHEVLADERPAMALAV
ncbi:MAG: uroporphyrinogen-III C-methyltransferase [Proteobacteria bacterium]|nr:uroporphyrinogen-III C-methyltransferase [Pseudomonadota bacterium]